MGIVPAVELPGPWLVVQVLDTWPRRRCRERYPAALQETLNAHDLVLYDLHPAVEDPDTLIVRCPDLPAEPTAVLRHAADLLARLLKLPSAQAIRIAAYPDLTGAHAAAGDARDRRGDGTVPVWGIGEDVVGLDGLRAAPPRVHVYEHQDAPGPEDPDVLPPAR